MFRQRGKTRTSSLPCSADQGRDEMASSNHREHPGRTSLAFLSSAHTIHGIKHRRLAILLLFVILTCCFLLARLPPIINGRIDSNIEQYSQLLEQWTIVRPPMSSTSTSSNVKQQTRKKNRGTVIAMLASSPSQNMMRIFSPSIHDKTTYAIRHNYSLVMCPMSLDEARDVYWSKLKLISLLLKEGYDNVLWLDFDTIINNKNMSVEDIIKRAGSGQQQQQQQQQPLLAQVDLHRKIDSLYINAGVMIIRNTPEAMQLLERAYRQWQVVLLKGLLYFDSDQDALSLSLGSNDVDSFGSWRRWDNKDGLFNPKRRHNIDKHGYTDEVVRIFRYGQLWALPKHVKDDTFVVHLPGCHGEACAKMLLDVRKD